MFCWPLYILWGTSSSYRYGGTQRVTLNIHIIPHKKVGVGTVRRSTTLSQIYPHWNWNSKWNTKLRLEFKVEYGFKLEFQVE